jgi:CBS domain-containing protein
MSKGDHMTTARYLLDNKVNEVWAVSPDTTLREALKMMKDQDIGVVVVNDAQGMVGIFSERDFARAAVSDENLNLNTPVSELMTTQVYCVHGEDLIEDCMALMTAKHIRHLPVLLGKEVVGMISITDVVRDIVSQKDTTIRSLENYIMGREYT